MGDKQIFCNNCKRKITEGNFVIHEVHCKRKIKLCELCGEPVVRSDLDNHLKEYHKLQECAFCDSFIEKWKLDIHEKDECHKRLINCKYCDLSQAFEYISEHEESCGSRTDQCSLCNGRFLIKNIEVHFRDCQRKNALKLQRVCSYCETETTAENHLEHVKSCVYRSEKCLTCGKLVRLKDLEEHGELHYRENSLQSCEHCGQQIFEKEFENHMANCKACFRTCLCCNEMVNISDLDDHLEVCRPVNRDCEHCGQRFSKTEIENHESNCKAQFKICGHCHKNVKISDLQDHLKNCAQHNTSSKKLLCNFCDLHFPAENFYNHVKRCFYRTGKCPTCGDNVDLEDIKEHMDLYHKKDKGNGTGAKCRYCDLNLSLDSISQHEERCGYRTDQCSFCKNHFLLKEKEAHLRACQKRKKVEEIVCEHCGIKFPSNILEKHELSCESRCEKCSLCNKFVKCVDMEHHVKVCGQIQTCQSKIACQHCEIKVPFKSIENHEKYCSFRFENCILCGDLKQVKDMDAHRRICEQKNASQMPVLCKYCELEFPLEELDYHQTACQAKVMKCHRCERMIKLRDFELHKLSCEENLYNEKDEIAKNYEVDQAQIIESDDQSVPCEYCLELFPLDCLEFHTETCGELSKKCISCNAVFKSKDKCKHDEKCMKPCDRLTKYNHCDVKFRSDALSSHIDSCPERIENCSTCGSPVMLRDKSKHMETCQQDVLFDRCPLCSLSLPKDELSEHFTACVTANSENVNSDYGNSLPTSKSDGTNDFKHEMQPESFKANTTHSLGNVQTCPYCSEHVPQKRFNNHKKYCKKAIIECPVCGDNYHVNESDEHKKECDALDKVLSQESDFSMEVHNKFETLNLEESMREKEAAYENCPFCKGKIPKLYFSNHLSYCSLNMKRCCFCEVEYPIDCEKDHFQVCPKVNEKKDDFLYSGFSKKNSKTEDYPENHIKCKGCKKRIPPGGYDSHLTFCKKIKKCYYCEELISGNIQKHLMSCNNYIKLQQESLNPSYGARPKNTNAQETESKLGKFFGNIKTIFSGAEKTNYTDSQTTRYPYSPCEGNLTSPPSAPPPEEIMFISCEFCHAKIPMDPPEAIVIHESGCNIDITSRLPDQKAGKQMSTENDYFYENQACSRPNEGRYMYKPCDRSEIALDVQAEKRQSEIRYSRNSENRDEISDDVQAEQRQNYTFMKNFDKFGKTKEVLYQEEVEKKASINHVRSESDEFGNKNVINNKKKMSSKYLKEKYKQKLTTGRPNIIGSENEFKPQENVEVEENAEIYRTGSKHDRWKVSTEPGEFLNKHFEGRQDHISSKKNEKFTNANVGTSDKLYKSCRELDQPISFNSRKCQYDKNPKERVKAANEDSWDKNESVHPTRMKDSCSRSKVGKVDDSDPEDSLELNSNFVPSVIEKRLHSKKDINAHHTSYPSQAEKVCDSQYDSEPESCKEIKVSNTSEDRFLNSETKQTFADTQSVKLSNPDLLNTKSYHPISRSEIRDSENDRISKRERHSKNCEYLKEHNSGYKVKKNLYPDISSFMSVDAYEERSKERSLNKFTKETHPTENDDICSDVKYSKYKLYSKTNTKDQEPMETDDTVRKPMDEANDYFLRSKKLQEITDSESKDSNMESYFEFLSNEKDEQPEIRMCEKCGNEVCSCKIQKSLSAVKHYRYTDKFENKGTDEHSEEETGNVGMKLYERNLNKYLKSKGSVDYKTRNQLDDNWRKYRSPVSSDDSE